MRNFIAKIALTATVLASFGSFLVAPLAVQADSASVDFESYTLGTVNGQDGWSSTGAAGSGCATYDHAIDSSSGTAGFGSKSLRISNSVTSGCFGDQTFSKSLANEAGETSAVNDGMSGGTRQPHFESQFSLASVTPNAVQTGLSMSVSPDRGDGARMSYLRFEDQADGVHTFFDDYKDVAPLGGAVGDANGCGTGDDFAETDIATLDRSVPHTVKFSINFVDGPGNDVVKIYLDGVLKATGTSWEDYFRYCEPNPTRPVDSMLFRTGGTAAPANAGKGFLVDNLSLQSGPIPTEGDQTCTDLTLTSGTSTHFTGLTTTDPAGSSADGLFAQGTAGNAVVAGPTGFPGAWDATSADPKVTGASWVNDSATQPTTPAGPNPGQDGNTDTWRLFSDSFTLPAGATVSPAPVVHFTADNSVQAFLDGSSIGTAPSYATVSDSSPLSLTPGSHTLKFVVKNDAYNGANNPTGLIYKTTIHYCAPNTPPPPTTLKVHILKYLDGVKATAVSAGGYQFPMTASWSASNIGYGTGNYVLGNGHGGAADLYGADTSAMSSPASYTTYEQTGGASKVYANVGQCTAGNYYLEGYQTSAVSFADATIRPIKKLAPSFAGLTADQYIIVRNITCPTTGKITGMKYNDLNKNGQKDANEPGLAGWTITLRQGNTVAYTTVTDANGNYTFTNVAPGNYKVREVHQAGWKRRSKNQPAYLVKPGSWFSGIDFGNSKKAQNESEDTAAIDNRDE